ncbi:Wzz/FepE/Etk N-terminal domain-containing protein [Thiomicrospira cyclica]|uniref:Lipopolysaccharide biosynthesis protein n=1 Tax=Thiomicrospira cyclica (strain DSM 14477 / JCM 11371 / ALM1) TaxID=717773 RepID=F6D8X8_THICA|nr:Wzz/FepE/Etk N-terminal domain-containing protein [Thiomicrospira cyclica]AEG31978.1 lipopolysaccharide biosynthesis protein [Thiomicrospira cyclica ALM1]
MNQHNPAPMPPQYDDEIDLYELWQTIWSQKWLIAIATIIMTVIAGLYAINMTPTYQSEASLLPPSSAQIDSIRLSELSGFNLERPTQESVYQTYLENLTSSEAIMHLLRLEPHQAFIQNELQLSETQAYRFLRKNLTITTPEISQKEVFKLLSTRIAFQASSPHISYEILSDFLSASADLTTQEIRNSLLTSIELKISRLLSEYEQENARVNREIEAEIKRLEEDDLESKTVLLQKFELENQRVNREIQAEIKRLEETDIEHKENLTEQIKLLREKAKLDREFRIARLKTDLNIAQALGIETPVNPSDYNRQAGNVSRIDINSQNPSRYWLGTKALTQEIRSLQQRTSDDPFISELPDLFRQLEALNVNQRIERLKNRQDNFPFSEELRSIQAKLNQLDEENIRILTLKNRTDNFPFSDSLRSLHNKLEVLNEAKTKIAQADFSVFRVAQLPMVPENPIKPNKKLIVAVALVLGGMLGIFIALIRGAVRKRKQMQVVD